jgi:hypothetical protein
VGEQLGKSSRQSTRASGNPAAQCWKRCVVLQALRKAVLVFSQTGADGSMKSIEAERLHFLHAFLGCPIFFCYALGRDGHPGSVHT